MVFMAEIVELDRRIRKRSWTTRMKDRMIYIKLRFMEALIRTKLYFHWHMIWLDHCPFFGRRQFQHRHEMAEALDTASRVLAQQYSIKLRELWDSWEWLDEELWDCDLWEWPNEEL
ncbi:hypothetical protein L2E82_32323 [Cichorium intybus]|uniref:Uncharacterized protein n=1 Tax=Cichorium intybus TaxID=13427 RepID=A0ACB9BHA2_CICIN|nr:hypothetical protein L2E82_32323 [Cichorium intybus]